MIKIDVKGYEHEVIKGGIRSIKKLLPNIIIVMEEKHHVDTIEKTSNYLYEIGYIGFYIDIVKNNINILKYSQIKALQNDYINGKNLFYINNFIFIAKEQCDYIIKEFEKRYGKIKVLKKCIVCLKKA